MLLNSWFITYYKELHTRLT